MRGEYKIYVRSNHTQTGDHKLVINEGEDALMPCTLTKVSVNDTVLWRRASTNEVLTAGSSRVTADKRINILHDKRKYNRPHTHTILTFMYLYLTARHADVCAFHMSTDYVRAVCAYIFLSRFFCVFIVRASDKRHESERTMRNVGAENGKQRKDYIRNAKVSFCL